MRLPLHLPEFLKGDRASERVVPPTGFTAALVIVSAAAMAFLAVIALALALSASRLADRWSDALDGTATVRVSAGEGQEAQADAAETALGALPGIASVRRISDEDQRELLAPWFGNDVPVDSLRLPVLIEVTETGDGPDRAALALALDNAAPGAVYDDHGRWRAPLVEAAQRLRRLGISALVLIAGVTGVTLALAASSALSANAQIIDVLRLVGAKDSFIAKAFVRRFTLRALGGAAVGTVFGMIAMTLIPGGGDIGVLGGIGIRGWEWLWPVLVPPVAALLAFAATRAAARRRLREVS